MESFREKKRFEFSLIFIVSPNINHIGKLSPPCGASKHQYSLSTFLRCYFKLNSMAQNEGSEENNFQLLLFEDHPNVQVWHFPTVVHVLQKYLEKELF